MLFALLVIALQTPSAVPRAARPATPRPAPAALVARALEAIGGADAVRNMPGLTIEYYQITLGLGQEETPTSPARASVTTGRTTTDWTGGRRAISTETRGPGGMINRQRRVTVKGISMLETTTGALQADPPGVVTNVERLMRTTPERILLAASEQPQTLIPIPPKEWRGDMADGVRYANGPDTLNLYFDRVSGLLLGAEQITDDPILGDRSNATVFTRWQDAGGGVRLPRQLDLAVNDRPQSNIVVTSATVAALPDSLFVIPDSIAARAQRPTPGATPPPVPLTLVELAPGVWRAEGGTHFSLVVEQPAQLVVVEAPQNAARTKSLLDTLRARFPQKPVGVVVNTHHHWDHAGGLRAVLAAGLTVLTQRRNVTFVRGIASARKTMVPDALTRRGRPGAVRAVDDTVTVGTGDSRVVVYRLPTTHAEGMLAAYVPAARILFTSDVLTPGANLAALGSSEIAALARTRGIAIERVVGGHGGIASWPDVERAAGN
jgi:glyoxylase-like metal-dependent hydrolase (beta-lactamase superfamily II)